MNKRVALYLVVSALLVLGAAFPSTSFSLGPSLRDQIRKRIAKRNILALPPITSQLKAFKRNGRFGSAAIPLAPPLITIPSLSIKDLFWREVDGNNVVDALNNNDPSAQYCGEFFAGTENDSSGGLGACHMAESIGFSYKTIAQGAISFCYMENFPSKGNLSARGITMVSGKLPAGGITQLFSIPSGSRSRVVKVNLVEGNSAAGTLYFRVNSAAANRAAKDIFSASLWLCTDGTVQDYDSITVTNSLRFIVRHGDTSPKSTSIDGLLTLVKDQLVWDSSKPRNGSTILTDEHGYGYKSDFQITKDNIITLRRVDGYEGRQGQGIFVTKYSGNTTDDIRLVSGAYKESYRETAILGAADYNGNYYAIDNQSALLAQVANEDLRSPYFTSPLDARVDTSSYSCASAAGIELTLNLANRAVQRSLRSCNKVLSDLQNMRFCLEDAEVSAAEERAVNSCN